MRVPQEIHLTLGESVKHGFQAAFRDFSAWSTSWVYSESASEQMTNKSTLVLHVLFPSPAPPNNPRAIFRETDNNHCVLDGTYDDKGTLSLDLHDENAKSLARDLRQYRRCCEDVFDVATPRPEIGIKHIVRSAPALRAWEAYMSMLPLSGHYHDDERLDQFTCEVFRGRRELDIDLLKKYLIIDHQWPEIAAKKCTHRIDVGLRVLRAYFPSKYKART